jgi:inner membrane protein
MIYTTHILFSCTLMILLMSRVEIFQDILQNISPLQALFIASFGSLIPDIDHPGSYISKKSWRLFSLSGSFQRHRGWTHSIFGSFVFSLIFFAYLMYMKANPKFIVPFYLGYISHLISDSLNPSRVAWFWPGKRRYGIGFIKTGSFEEAMLQIALITLLSVSILMDMGLI